MPQVQTALREAMSDAANSGLVKEATSQALNAIEAVGGALVCCGV
jgi:hypothetical protein